MNRPRTVLVADRFVAAERDGDEPRVLLVVQDDRGAEGAVSLPAGQMLAALPSVEDAAIDVLDATGSDIGHAYIVAHQVSAHHDEKGVFVEINVPGRLHPARVGLTFDQARQLRNFLATAIAGRD